MPGASYEALRRMQRGEPASEAAPAAILTALRKVRQANALEAAQHSIDLQSMAVPGKPETFGQRVARERASDYVAGGVDPGKGLGLAGATVYHGSPHLFSKFDSSKIGTGEGAQVYGHGLYLAGEKKVAEGYRERLAKDFYVGGKPVTDPIGVRAAKRVMLSRSVGSKDPVAQVEFSRDLDRRLGKLTPEREQMHNEVIEQLRQWQAAKLEPQLGGGLYSVDLPDEQIAKMLDWDAKLRHQPPSVVEALQSMQNPEVDALLRAGRTSTGENLVRTLAYQAPAGRAANYKNMGPAFASEKLNAAGIPGTKYDDSFTRHGLGGAQTQNYVVYPGRESMLTILDRNGYPVDPAAVQQNINDFYSR